jgi:hypothetical protein
VVGESPKRYLMRTRLAHAATLLHQTDASLAEIALQIGYGSEFSFARAFKRTFGIAPGTYRGQPHGVPGLGRDPMPPPSPKTPPVRSARGSATHPEELPLGLGWRHGGRPLVGGRRLAVSAEPAKQIGAGGVE